MKHKEKQIKQEGGITLIALIITIIVLVILAAVTLNSIFGNNIIEIATNGAINYAEEQQKELGMLNDVSDLLGEVTGDTDRPMMPSITLDGTKGNNDIFTSNVTVEISINRGIEQTGVIKLHYQINDGEEQITEEDVSLEIDTEGTTKIIVWAENERGNISDKQEISFTINKTAPSNPTISLAGTEGENGYYITNIGVIINAGDTSNVASIKYKVEGANPIQETEVQGANATFDITQDGTSTITAYIINNAGLTSETITKEVNKDEAGPSTATIALSGEAEETSITVNANGEDATSGIASYSFQYSTTSSEDGFTTKEEVKNTSTSCTYTYQDLTSDTTYYLRVVVKDRAGKTTESLAVTVRTKTAELNFGEMTEEEINEEIGKYVDYTPTYGNFSEHTNSSYSGSSENSSVSTDTSIKWEILSVGNNILTLISDKAVNSDFTLYGYNGYNNGVLLLNNACKAMYSNSSLGAEGRSLNIDDIETVSSYSGASLDEEKPLPIGYRYYPNIYRYEETGAPHGTYGEYGKFGLSEQENYITGYTYGSTSFKGKSTSYNYTMSTTYMSEKYVTLFSSSTPTWVASRCMFYGGWFVFSVFYIDNNEVNFSMLYFSDNGTGSESGPSLYGESYALRPVVEIDLTKVNIGLTGDGSSTSPYSIELK